MCFAPCGKLSKKQKFIGTFEIKLKEKASENSTITNQQLKDLRDCLHKYAQEKLSTPEIDVYVHGTNDELDKDRRDGGRGPLGKGQCYED